MVDEEEPEPSVVESTLTRKTSRVGTKKSPTSSRGRGRGAKIISSRKTKGGKITSRRSSRNRN